MSGVTVPPDVVEWLDSGERGLSSECMVEHLFGLPLNGRDWPGVHHPEDPADFRRCALLVEQCPSVDERLDDMASASPRWRRLVDVWDDLLEALDADVPGWRDGADGNATTCYKMMTELREAS